MKFFVIIVSSLIATLALMTTPSRKTQQTLERILDAAMQCYSSNGIASTTLDEVANTAGIGRTTLYRYVRNRDDLLNQVLLRDAEQQQADMLVVSRYHLDPQELLVESVVHIMRGRKVRPMNKLLFGTDKDAMIDRINLSPANFYPMAAKLMEPLFEKAAAEGRLRTGVELDKAVSWLTRIILSLITYPEEFLDDEAALRKYLHDFLVPSLLN